MFKKDGLSSNLDAGSHVAVHKMHLRAGSLSDTLASEIQSLPRNGAWGGAARKGKAIGKDATDRPP